MKKADLLIYCCTYRNDLLRVKRLFKSISNHNIENIPFYISVPEEDLLLFHSEFKYDNVNIINESDIVNKNPKINQIKLYEVRGWIRQQVIKSEFWRLNLCENYLVVDSDCEFIRNFTKQDFLFNGLVPYSVIHEGKSVLQSTEIFGPQYTRKHFINDRDPIRAKIGRPGVIYDYGYAPFLWSSKVWESLDMNFLTPNDWSILDAILFCSSEFTWYGESLLKFCAIPIIPREELFYHYHYEHQLWLHNLLGINRHTLSNDYIGVVYQSNWETWYNYGKTNKSIISRAIRSLKRSLKRIRFNLIIFINYFK